MKRILVALPAVALLVAAAWPGARVQPAEQGLCEVMTPARMLENPGLAHQYAEALRSGEASEVARMRSLLEEIRTAHGCAGAVALPDVPSGAARLPPGHPPIDGPGRAPRLPMFAAPDVVTI